MPENVCDFCSDTPVKWAFPARDFTTPLPFNVPIDHGSHGGWAACEPCHDLIQRGDRDGLAERAAQRYVRVNRMPRGMVRQLTGELRRLHDNFWANREGAPVPAEPDTSDPTR